MKWCLFISIDLVIGSSVYGVAAYSGEARGGGVFLFVLWLQLWRKQEEFAYHGSYSVTKQAGGIRVVTNNSLDIRWYHCTDIYSDWKLYMIAVKVHQLRNDCKALLLWTLLNQMRPILKFTERFSIIKLLQSRGPLLRWVAVGVVCCGVYGKYKECWHDSVLCSAGGNRTEPGEE